MNYDNFFVISDVFIFLAVTGSVLNLSLCRALKFHARFHTVKFCGMGHSDKSLQTWSVASVNHKPLLGDQNNSTCQFYSEHAQYNNDVIEKEVGGKFK